VKVALLTPTTTGPHPAYLAAMEATVPVLDAAGIEHGLCVNPGNPYISFSRAFLLRKGLDWGADAYVFIDHDLSWRPEDLLALIKADGEVVGGTYRYKADEVAYMGAFHTHDDGRPETRDDGAIRAHSLPAGFLKLTAGAVDRFMRMYPELVFGVRYKPTVDLFNHGVLPDETGGTWYGEDMAFCKRWREKCGELWLLPDIDLNHHTGDVAYEGNLHRWLLRQPGGSEFKEAA